MPDNEVLRPLCKEWMEALKAAKKSKSDFDKVAQQCMGFYRADLDFMWKSPLMKNLMGGVNPKFKMTIAKAFEFVAIVGPSLFWKNPTRLLKQYKPMEFDPNLFARFGEQGQMMYEQQAAQQQQEDAENDLRSKLVETWLNYTPNEQKSGGLWLQSQLAVTELLIKGRGLLWPEIFQFAGSDMKMTGLFYDSVDNFFVDPDCVNPDLSDAWWIMKKHTMPYWEVERKFNLPAGSLKKYCSIESGDAQARQTRDKDNTRRRKGETFDLLEWYEIWSKAGLGYKLREMERGEDEWADDLGKTLENLVGDNAYLCIAEGVPFPLNCPVNVMESATDPEIAQRFEWPVPTWRDGKWPVAILDAYHQPGSAWPIAPLAPGLGPLMFINIMTSHLANRIWSSSRDFIAILQSASTEIEEAIKSGNDLTVIPLKDGINKSIKDVVQFLQQPQANLDMWKIQEFMADIFEKSTGLNEFLYGVSSSQSRSAQDAQNKKEFGSVRIHYLESMVDKWQDEAADLEKFFMRFAITAKDVAPRMGQMGAYWWDELITKSPVEMTVFNLRAKIVANSSRRPDKEKDADNMNKVMPFLVPEFSKHADATGDTQPFNNLLARYGEAVEMDMDGLQMGPRQPERDPQQQAMEQQAQEQQMQMQQAQIEADLQGKQLDLQIKREDAQRRGEEAFLKSQADQQKLALEQQSQQLDLVAQVQQMQLDREKTEMELEAQQAQTEMNLQANHATVQQKLMAMGQQHQLKMQQAKQQAKAKPKTVKQGGRK